LVVLRNGVEMPGYFSRLAVDRQDVTAGDVTLAPSAADVEHPVVELRRGREPVPHADGRFHLRVSRGEHVENHARLTVLAEASNWLPGLRVERKQERTAGRVDHAVGIHDAAVTEDVAL